MANTVQPVSLADSVTSILTKRMVYKNTQSLSYELFSHCIHIYLKEENGDAEVGEYLCGLLHFLKVHDVEDDDEKHHHHHSGTGYGS